MSRPNRFATCALLAAVLIAGCATAARNWQPSWNEQTHDTAPPFHADDRDVGR